MLLKYDSRTYGFFHKSSDFPDFLDRKPRKTENEIFTKIFGFLLMYEENIPSFKLRLCFNQKLAIPIFNDFIGFLTVFLKVISTNDL